MEREVLLGVIDCVVVVGVVDDGVVVVVVAVVLGVGVVEFDRIFSFNVELGSTMAS